MTAPVLLIAFARPDHTQQVWNRIRQAAPEHLFVALDAPRTHGDESERVERVRSITREVDWPCSVEYLLQETNLGPGLGPRAAISWFFSNVDKGIILEDDTVPDPSFFPFATEMLERFAEDERVTSISGTSFAADRYHGNDSYFASRYATTWGWATWQRVWSSYDPDISDWDDRRSSSWLRDVGGPEFAAHWTNVFDMVRGDLDEYWDYQFQYAAWKRDSIAIHPAVNLITNIGQGDLASHTVAPAAVSARRDTTPMSLPLAHPEALHADLQIDQWIDRHIYGTRRSLRGRLARSLARGAESVGVPKSFIQRVVPDA